ncbi:hypothetical protein [Bacillus massiliglaciei]|uniref:hypothetical protein n=1 Tax=Bacillus massiliglaciei TaxID=1816693 RepID=UPI000DA63F19|nr:hypothetical protein [Bacillus massiliglaciei]
MSGDKVVLPEEHQAVSDLIRNKCGGISDIALAMNIDEEKAMTLMNELASVYGHNIELDGRKLSNRKWMIQEYLNTLTFFEMRSVRAARNRMLNEPDAFKALRAAPYFDKGYVLQKFWDNIPANKKVKFLTEAWINAGFAMIEGYHFWLPYFKEVGFFSNCGLERPKNKTVLYRGAPFKSKRGMPWTSDLETALYFKNKWNEDGDTAIYKTIADSEIILAILEADPSYGPVSEEVNIVEYVLDPRCIGEIIEID